MSADASIALDTTDVVRFKEKDITWLFGPLRPAVDYDGRAHRCQPTYFPPRTSAAILKPIMRKTSIRKTMLQSSQYTMAQFSERIPLPENRSILYSPTRVQVVDDAISDVVLRKCVRFDMEAHDGISTEHGISNACEQVDLGANISVNF